MDGKTDWSSDSSSLVAESMMVFREVPNERRWLNDGESKALLESSSEESRAMRSWGSIDFRYRAERSRYRLKSCILGEGGFG